MGKAAKRERQDMARERQRLSAELGVAGQAQQLWDDRWRDTVESLFTTLEAAMAHPDGSRPRLKRIGPNEIMGLRSRLRATKSWPPYCWVPATLVAQVMLIDVVEPARSLFTDVVLGTTQQLVGLAAWRNAPLVVRFDPDIAAALLDTPLNGEIPRDLLRRLPAPALFVDTPWLGAGCGVFVSMDSAHDRGGVRHEDLDEILFTVVADSSPALLTFLRLDQPTVRESIAASVADAAALPLTLADPTLAEDETMRRFGRSLATLTSELLSLLLYLASDEPDAVPSVVGRAIAPRSTVTTVPVDMKVLDVGARLGAALRSPAPSKVLIDEESDEESDESGGDRLVHRPVSHLRRAHWHTFWTGPKSDPALRVAKLRWVHMIQVGSNMPVTVRTVTGD